MENKKKENQKLFNNNQYHNPQNYQNPQNLQNYQMQNPQMPQNPQIPQNNLQNFQNNYQNPQMQQLVAPPFIPHKQKIMLLNGIFVKQKWSKIEVFTGCEMENKYKIYKKHKDKTKKIGKILYKAKEKSGCCSRNCLIPQCRPMQVKIKNISSLDEDPTCLKISKDCNCMCFCLNRPFINIDYCEEGQNEFIGKIEYPFNCCDFNFIVYDNNDNKVFKIFTECCQCGICCAGCGCEKTEKVDFVIYDVNDKKIGFVRKRNKDCLKSVFSDADNFGVDFDVSWDWKIRSILLGTMLFIDYMMFEEKQ